MLDKLLPILGVVIVLGVVVLYIKGQISSKVRADTADANAALERSRTEALEAAEAAQRAARAKEFDEKASAVHSAADAARLLLDTTGAGKPPTAPVSNPGTTRPA